MPAAAVAAAVAVDADARALLRDVTHLSLNLRAFYGVTQSAAIKIYRDFFFFNFRRRSTLWLCLSEA